MAFAAAVAALLAEVAAASAVAGTAAAGTAAAAAPAVAGTAGALGAAGAGAAGAALPALTTAGTALTAAPTAAGAIPAAGLSLSAPAAASSAIPAVGFSLPAAPAVSALPAETLAANAAMGGSTMGSGAESIAALQSMGHGGSNVLATGSGAAGSTPWHKAFFAPTSTGGQALTYAKGLLPDMPTGPKTVMDYAKLGQMAGGMFGGGGTPPPPTPPPLQRPAGSAIPVASAEALQARTISPSRPRLGGMAGLSPDLLRLLASLSGGR